MFYSIFSATRRNISLVLENYLNCLEILPHFLFLGNKSRNSLSLSNLLREKIQKV